ncbi:Arc family DNA-binding protein [Morganella morganii]|uniref:Arc family DNA-binding protein n=1 Tax=Morganella morganii TaxID=582 RepID=UPI000CFA2FA3|nr:Arc family DNA-binding protein [Morganella morganii]
MSRIAPYPLRMPPEMREEIEKEAAESHRSLQQEIIYRLESYRLIESLLRSMPIKGDAYSQVMVLAQAFKQAEQQAEKIEAMKKDMALLAESTKSSDIDRFLKISQQLDIIRAAVDKSLKEIPPRYEDSDKNNPRLRVLCGCSKYLVQFVHPKYH